MTTPEAHYSVVIPTTGRPSLATLLQALDHAAGPEPEEVVIVDDRPHPAPPLALPATGLPVHVVQSDGRGPAAARNVGWRSAGAEWVVFLDDDVIPDPLWRRYLQRDLDVAENVAGCQGEITVPLPDWRRHTDSERGVAGLSTAWWITADMAYRRRALAATGGFDERFARAFREDADLALRMQSRGWRLVDGSRRTDHPARRSGFFASVRAQAGNADNALMRRKYGGHWRKRIGEGSGRIRQHGVTTAAAVTALVAACGRGRAWRATARLGAAVWLAMTAEFALRRILPGPRNAHEVTRMLVTSILIPPVACWFRLRGELGHRSARRRKPAAVLFDRDGTLIDDVPYNGDPARVSPVPGARQALDRLRVEDVRIGVVSNQSGVARGVLSPDDVAVVNAEVERQVGPMDTWQTCMHGPDEGCGCRKPAPGLIERAAAQLGVASGDCVVIGDIGADVEAAKAAGAHAVLVPTDRTRPEEITRAVVEAKVAPTLEAAVDQVLRGAP
ncbi:HAD-IIIA family hydrolase [Saccharopolyspora sp. 5N102]|uniref:HAD-IIIA family hydrolase n=1 Tax=Saccharopolyspora sp. 5N102 TaxID=3375155 RepID=UPI00379E6E3E